jgi:hypothetical protein
LSFDIFHWSLPMIAELFLRQHDAIQTITLDAVTRADSGEMKTAK